MAVAVQPRRPVAAVVVVGPARLRQRRWRGWRNRLGFDDRRRWRRWWGRFSRGDRRWWWRRCWCWRRRAQRPAVLVPAAVQLLRRRRAVPAAAATTGGAGAGGGSASTTGGAGAGGPFKFNHRRRRCRGRFSFNDRRCWCWRLFSFNDRRCWCRGRLSFDDHGGGGAGAGAGSASTPGGGGGAGAGAGSASTTTGGSASTTAGGGGGSASTTSGGGAVGRGMIARAARVTSPASTRRMPRTAATNPRPCRSPPRRAPRRSGGHRVRLNPDIGPFIPPARRATAESAVSRCSSSGVPRGCPKNGRISGFNPHSHLRGSTWHFGEPRSLQNPKPRESARLDPAARRPFPTLHDRLFERIEMIVRVGKSAG